MKHVFQKEVSGGATIYLGQDRDIWRPLMQTTVNLSEIQRYVSGSKTLHHEGFISAAKWKPVL